MKKVKYALVRLSVAVVLAVSLQYENRVEVLPIKPPLTRWQRSVVRDGPAVAARWQKIIERALVQHRSSVPADLVVGFMLTESMGRPRAIHPRTRAAGLLGVRPIVCKELKSVGCNLFNPEKNVALGIRYLGRLQAKYGFEGEQLILAYGAGPERAKEILRTKDPRGHRYVRKVLYARSLGKTYLANS